MTAKSKQSRSVRRRNTRSINERTYEANADE